MFVIQTQIQMESWSSLTLDTDWTKLCIRLNHCENELDFLGKLFLKLSTVCGLLGLVFQKIRLQVVYEYEYWHL